MNRIRPNSFTVGFALLVCVGCNGSGGLDKVIVEGTVTYNGNPIENGEIRFRPTEGTQGPVSGAPIVDGQYRAEAKGGVPVGKHIVQIEAYRASGPGGAGDMISSGRAGVRVNYLPSKYHRESELIMDIPGDANTFTLDFQLDK